MKKNSGKLARKPVGQLEPLAQVPPDERSTMDWIRRLDALPLKQENKAIRENPEVLAHLYGAPVPKDERRSKA